MSVGHYENFPVASRLLPARLRPAVVAIYRFARTADDLADEGDADPDTRLAALDRLAAGLDRIEAGASPDEPPLHALGGAIRAHGLPLAPFRDLLSAFRQDVTTTRYATFSDLADYCRRSANPVGRLMLALFRADDATNLAASDAICTGLQLANFWQDVALDWAKGRLYLPQEDLQRFGVDEGRIAAARADGPWPALMAFQTARARTLLQRGRPLAHALPLRTGLEIGAVVAGGLRILDRIDAIRGDVFTRRPVLRRRDWLAIAAQALAAVRAPATVPA